jgi:hypothetical protein
MAAKRHHETSHPPDSLVYPGFDADWCLLLGNRLEKCDSATTPPDNYPHVSIFCHVPLLVIAVAEDLIIAIQTLIAKPAPEVVAEIALAESEAHPTAVRCLMNTTKPPVPLAEHRHRPVFHLSLLRPSSALELRELPNDVGQRRGHFHKKRREQVNGRPRLLSARMRCSQRTSAMLVSDAAGAITPTKYSLRSTEAHGSLRSRRSSLLSIRFYRLDGCDRWKAPFFCDQIDGISIIAVYNSVHGDDQLFSGMFEEIVTSTEDIQCIAHLHAQTDHCVHPNTFKNPRQYGFYRKMNTFRIE